MLTLFYHQKRNSHRSILLTVIFLLITILTPVSTPSTINSADTPAFIITTDYNLYYTPNDSFVTVEETLTLEAKDRNYFYPAQTERSFLLPDFTLNEDPQERAFKTSTLTILDERGIELDKQISEIEGGLEVTVPETRDVTFWNSEKFTIRYNTHELVDQVGNVTNLYIPGLPEDTSFISTDDRYGLTTEYRFNTNLHVPKDSPSESFMMPQGGIGVSEDSNTRKYSVTAQDRIGTTAWIQLGTTQYFYFKLIQDTPKTDNIVPEEVNKYSDLLSTNVYELPLPREHSETDQRVFFTKIDPYPTAINRDDEGNLLATFEVPANKDGQIIIEGYIKLTSDGEMAPEDMSLNEYLSLTGSDLDIQQYTRADKYWESNDEFIINIAEDLWKESSTILELINNDYDRIIQTFDYSYSKVEGENPRIGALSALSGGPAVCMEYSDSLIAILRAQGIPARAAIGYGNDPIGAENNIGASEASVQNIGHQWVQVWLPDYGWLSVDPTWGESGRRYIGGNLDHILWYTIGNSDQGFIGTALSTADPITAHVLTSYDVYLQALTEEEFTNANELTSLQELLIRYEGVEVDPISYFLKTTSIGKIIVFIIPIASLLIALMFISALVSTFRKIYKKQRS